MPRMYTWAVEPSFGPATTQALTSAAAAVIRLVSTGANAAGANRRRAWSRAVISVVTP